MVLTDFINCKTTPDLGPHVIQLIYTTMLKHCGFVVHLSESVLDDNLIREFEIYGYDGFNNVKIKFILDSTCGFSDLNMSVDKQYYPVREIGSSSITEFIPMVG